MSTVDGCVLLVCSGANGPFGPVADRPDQTAFRTVQWFGLSVSEREDGRGHGCVMDRWARPASPFIGARLGMEMIFGSTTKIIRRVPKAVRWSGEHVRWVVQR
jgi:hypothetical protein